MLPLVFKRFEDALKTTLAIPFSRVNLQTFGAALEIRTCWKHSADWGASVEREIELTFHRNCIKLETKQSLRCIISFKKKQKKNDVMEIRWD